jgi:hypothetical protein
MVDGLRERVEEWDERPVPDGLTGLATLAEEEFDGVVIAGPITATFVSGRVLHVDGAVDDAEDASLTVKVAPSPELALLVAMNATGGEPQAQYYTEDTDIESIDERLQSGGFTGYIELAENVLSGSYYRLYYGGTARSVAFVGINDRAITGTEAYDRTLEEVGIYEVVPVDISVTELPGPPEPVGGEAVAAADSASGTDTPGSGGATAGETATDGLDTGDGDHNGMENSAAATVPDPEGDTADTTANAATSAEDGTAPGSDDDSTVGADPGTADRRTDDPTVDSARDSAVGVESGSVVDTEEGTSREAAGTESIGDGTATDASSDGSEAAGADPVGVGSSESTPESASDPGEAAASGDLDGTDGESTDSETALSAEDVDSDQPSDQQLQDLHHRVAALERQVQTLHSRSSTASAGSSDDGDGSPRATGDERSPTDVLGETDCLVRYETRAGATIGDLLEGDASTETVRENLRIETNTTFDADAATVDGTPFQEFFGASLERRVVGWLLCDLPTEIVATDSRGALSDLVEALPDVDRIGFQETVDLASFGEEPLGEESPESVGFDLVAWGSDGHPRIVADLNRSTEPVGEGAVSALIARGKSLANRTDLAAVLFATDGYYEADARRAVEATTGGGLLARDARASYVKMTRKRGFHCCLAEAYDEAIHLTVPEL